MAIARSLFIRNMRSIFSHPLFLFFCLGLFLRLVLLFADYSWDVHNHIAWAKDLWMRGSVNFYTTQSSEVYATLYPNYPPGALLFFYVVYPLQAILFKCVWFLNTAIPAFPSNIVLFIESRAFLAGLMKLPAVLFDLGLAYLCYRYLQKIAPKKMNQSKTIVSLVLFNPAFFFNSALWGQIDVIPIFFAMIALYLLLFTQKYTISSACFVIGLLIKPTILVFLPVYVFLFFQKATVKQIVNSFVFGIVLFWASFIPFIGWNVNPFTTYVEKILATQSLPFVTNGAYNFWMLFTRFEGIKDTATFVFNVSYRVWGYALLASFLLFIIYYLFKAKIKDEKQYQRHIYFSFTLSALAAFLFLTKMHERYSMLYLPFLILLTIIDKKIIQWAILLSVLSFLNLYHSWSVPKIAVATVILDNMTVVVALSTLTIGVFLYLLRRYVSFSSLNNK